MNREDLLKISKPTRYLGGEVNSVVKDWAAVRLKFALAFPDVYEVGMSHLGLQILYHILNQHPDVACERVFAPWPDMEKLLREKSLPLSSLESSRPLKSFDVIGFSLLYELNYTGILNILDLAGIPLRAVQRGEEDPFIIGGGPCTMNPEPLADFFDAFVLGDGEEVVLEIVREMIAAREKDEKKENVLERLSKLEGVYIPSFFRIEYEPDGRIEKMIPLKEGHSSVIRRVLPDLDNGAFPLHPLLPFMEVIHDRLNVELARGCTRGCRFCQAGMIYRPLRERSPGKILEFVGDGLRSTGHDEVSLLSLSAGDYSGIEPLLSSIIDRYGPERVAVSLPSLRTETLTPLLIQKIQDVRKTGFTLAPEAGSERLRRVINKGNTEEDLLRTIPTVFSAGWQLVKLYFMIGLPTETEEDLRGIVSLCRQALKMARQAKGSAQLNVSVSTFIPKAHTPFQWEPQSSGEEVRKKQDFLRKQLRVQGLNLKWPDVPLSLLEGVLARGDRRLSPVLEAAYHLGCRLDGWGDHFRYDLWVKAFDRLGIDPAFYLRSRELDEPLPWDHLDSRVSKRFLQEEREKAFQEISTPDCRRASCNGCGVCFGKEALTNHEAEDSLFLKTPPLPKIKGAPFLSFRYRSQYTKTGPAKFLGHLELSRAIIRAFRRAKISLQFSQGFHPLPKVSFGPPIPVGYESFAEFLDFHAGVALPPEEIQGRLNAHLPRGIRFLKTQEISLKSPSIFDSIIDILYIIRFPDSVRPGKEILGRFLEMDSFPVFWKRKNRTIDLKNSVTAVSLINDRALKMKVTANKEGSPKPEEALHLIFGWPEDGRPPLTVQKFRMKLRDSA